MYTYCLVGLMPSERALLESLFELDRKAGGAPRPASAPEEAQLLLVNGDDRASVERMQAMNPDALLVVVGGSGGGRLARLPALRRPLELEAVVDVLSRLQWPSVLPGSDPTDFGGTFAPHSDAPSTRPPPFGGEGESGVGADASASGLSAFAPTTASAPLAMSAHASAAAWAGERARAGGPAAAAPGEPARGAALSPTLPPGDAGISARATWASSERAPLGADVDVALGAGEVDGDCELRDADVLVVIGAQGQRSRTLTRGIRRLGFRVRLVAGVDAARAALAERAVPFVFLDQMTLGEGLLPLARAISALRPVPGAAPHVVLVARKGNPIERLRARMAGCSWMAVPVDRERLLAYFAKRGLRPS